MDSDGKKPHKTKITNFYKLHMNIWGIFKMKVYEGNWTAKNREALIRRLKIKQKEIDQDIVIKMFEIGLV